MAALVLHCNSADYDAVAQTCAAPYYAEVPSPIPELSFEDGLLIAGAVGSVWTLGLIARVLIRVQQLATRT